MKFLVYKNGEPAKSLDLSGAYIFDPERIPLRVSRDISFNDSVIDIHDPGTISAGLALHWEIDGVGKIMLPTTKLNITDKPYLLNLELARARLMEITKKCEDWSVFDEDKSNTQKAIAQAKSLFIDAMTCTDDPAKCSKLADKSLHRAVVASESLAQKQTAAVLTSKKSNGGMDRYTLGCTYQSEFGDNPEYIKKLTEYFGQVSIPVSWADIEKKKGQYDFSQLDKIINKFSGQKVFITAGPLIRFEEKYIPQWLDGSNFEHVQERVYQFIWDVVKNYSGKVHQWNLISGMNCYNCFNFGFDECIEITRTACVSAKATDSKVLKMVEIVSPWSCYHIDNPYTISSPMYADLLVNNAIIFDCMGIKLGFGGSSPDCFVRDLMQISSMLDRLCVTSRPVHISGVFSPSLEKDQTAGYWRKQWDENSHASWLEALYRIFLGKTQISSVVYSALADSAQNGNPCIGLFDSSLKPKVAAKTIRKFNKFILQ